jgi:hypothetical protein
MHDPGTAASTGATAAPEHLTPPAGRAPIAGDSAAAPPGQAENGWPATRPGAPRPLSRAGGLAAMVPPRWRLPLATYLACQVIFLAWWAAYYPAILSYDSVFYVLHVTTGPWVDNHSVLYDAMVWLSLHTTGGLAALTLAQTAAMSAALGYTVAAFRRHGVPGRWTAIAAVIVAALPPTGVFIVYLWKDVPYVICGFLIVPTLAHLLDLRRRPGSRRDRRVSALVAALGLEMLGMSLFRINGFTIVAIAAVLLVCLLPGIRAALAAAAGMAIGLALLLNLVVYPAAGIQRAPSSLAYGPVYADLAVAYKQSPRSLTHADKALMTQVAPLASWKKAANCYNSDPTTRIPGFKANGLRLSGKITALWLRLFKRSPELILAARICRSSIAWSIFQASGWGSTQIQPTSPPARIWPLVRHNRYRSALFSRPLSATMHRLANFLWNASRTRQLDWLLFRGAFWAYLSYLALFAFARARRNWAVLSLGAIVAAQQLGLLPDTPAADYRYMMVDIIIGIMLVPLFFARGRPEPAVGDLPASAARRSADGT